MGKDEIAKSVRHKSDGDYARLLLNGKKVWKFLRTKHFSVAEAPLAETQKKHRERQATKATSSNAKMTFQQTVALHSLRLAIKSNIKQSTRHYWDQIHTSLQKRWPDLVSMEMRRLTPATCREGNGARGE